MGTQKHEEDTMNIAIASDHAAYDMKECLKSYLREKGYAIEDMGAYSPASAHWPVYGARAAELVSQNPSTIRGILLCGSGIGMSMVANKFKNVRAALCRSHHDAEMSRRHNDANVLCLGGRSSDEKTILKIVDVWLGTAFDGGRHQERLDILKETVEDVNFK